MDFFFLAFFTLLPDEKIRVNTGAIGRIQGKAFVLEGVHLISELPCVDLCRLQEASQMVLRVFNFGLTFESCYFVQCFFQHQIGDVYLGCGFNYGRQFVFLFLALFLLLLCWLTIVLRFVLLL